MIIVMREYPNESKDNHDCRSSKQNKNYNYVQFFYKIEKKKTANH